MTDSRQALVERIGAAFRDGYRREKKHMSEILVQMESPEERQRLAVAEPELAKHFEQHTTAEREVIGQELAMGTGVAHAILEAVRALGLVER